MTHKNLFHFDITGTGKQTRMDLSSQSKAS